VHTINTFIATNSVTSLVCRVATVNGAWEKLRAKLDELADIGGAASLMSWDQAVMMPPAGAGFRARSMATLSGLYHEKLTHPEIGELLDELAGNGGLGEAEHASVRVLTRDYERATKIPSDLVRAIAEAEGLAYQAWTEARPADDFSLLAPHLETLFSLKKQEADALGWENERYDALLDNFEPEMVTSEVEAIFDELVVGLKPIVEKALDVAGPRPEFLAAEFDVSRQLAFCEWLVDRLGFDANGGRLDSSPHPFTIRVGRGDVRQTTKAEPRNLLMSIYAVIHETGHALYEQGIPEELIGLPAGRVPSLGLHESQSRLWENHVGRSRAFTDFLLPHLKDRFPDQLGTVDPDAWYAAVNHPQRTLIRVSADELTYNLHVAMRFELELRIMRDQLEIRDLPAAWIEAQERHVGIAPTNDADGVMQDMHWAMGASGYFSTYTLGTLYAAAFYERAESDLSGLQDEIRAGECGRLLEWLREHVHSHAFLRPAKEIGERVLGGPLSATPFLEYLSAKYGALYS
jgi:carboxypeptidase Taq